MPCQLQCPADAQGNCWAAEHEQGSHWRQRRARLLGRPAGSCHRLQARCWLRQQWAGLRLWCQSCCDAGVAPVASPAPGLGGRAHAACGTGSGGSGAKQPPSAQPPLEMDWPTFKVLSFGMCLYIIAVSYQRSPSTAAIALVAACLPPHRSSRRRRECVLALPACLDACREHPALLSLPGPFAQRAMLLR